ncbi:hypothetical protein V6N13_133791 [Hibiscus sabdariffa]
MKLVLFSCTLRCFLSIPILFSWNVIAGEDGGAQNQEEEKIAPQDANNPMQQQDDQLDQGEKMQTISCKSKILSLNKEEEIATPQDANKPIQQQDDQLEKGAEDANNLMLQHDAQSKQGSEIGL